jgi:hypothetical protein
MEYFDTEYNVVTGETKITPWTQERIDAVLNSIVEEQSQPTIEELKAQLADLQAKINSL